MIGRLGIEFCPILDNLDHEYASHKIRQMEETKHDLQSVIIAWSGITRNERTAR
jgi:hypothetical protein